ncbi:MAG: hypothetical protein FWC77_06525 [Defluviitaleaceae bacterium]|nr:hypothetical protein [Defluviitaleaceae bacterium]
MKWRRDNKWALFKANLWHMRNYFCLATTVLILVNGGMAWASGGPLVLYSRDLMRILLAALGAVLPILIFVFFEDSMPGGAPVLRLVHFITTAVLVVGTLLVIEPTGRDFSLRTGILFLVIYVAIYMQEYLKDRAIALKVNRKLDEIHINENASCPDENATHRD